MCEDILLEDGPVDVQQTFQLLSDGKDLFWLYSLQSQETVTHPVTGEKIKQHPLILHILHFKVQSIGIQQDKASNSSP